MPVVLAGIGIECDDRGRKKVVFACSCANLVRPRPGVPGANIDRLELFIISEGIPRRAAAAKFPPFTRPGLGGPRLRSILKSFCRIAGYREKAPGDFSCLRIHGRYRASPGRIGTRRADNNLVPDN